MLNDDGPHIARKTTKHEIAMTRFTEIYGCAVVLRGGITSSCQPPVNSECPVAGMLKLDGWMDGWWLTVMLACGLCFFFLASTSTPTR
ncbi:hypothetical protein OPV22_015799 [Ensete ventricosum]|uniref:Uncharacterized protein n=1 Tax=Ensete ventricosum TaxID=4639 RepID=A0AAV8PMT8_ENSVE|nr:hypothetical protein OPV22_015799 [Ensete ventricosum]